MDILLDKTWRSKLSNEFDKMYYKSLMAFVESEYKEYPGKIFPEKQLVFDALNNCPFETIKVVIIGQDPYPTKGHANGLCFSTEKSVKPLPKSLNNIFKELESDLLKPAPENGDLSKWSNQGVLLLNTVLTVREGEADSHALKGWEAFTDAIIDVVNKELKNVVYILWGAKAQKKGLRINKEDNLVLKASHPSPLSSYRGFFGSKPFSKSNDYLEDNGAEKIDW